MNPEDAVAGNKARAVLFTLRVHQPESQIRDVLFLVLYQAMIVTLHLEKVRWQTNVLKAP